MDAEEVPMRHRAILSVALAVLVLPLFATGCPKKKAAPPADSTTAPAKPAAPAKPTPAPREVEEPGFEGNIPEEDVDQGSLDDLASRMRTVYFAFDSYELTPTSIATLRENANLLKAHGGATIVVEGHADERGSIEYNLTLSEKRANAVRDYLSSLGVDRGRVRVVPYGEERPAATGHDETAWSKNRRAEFIED
jgi:peptidoglycan-associated lipoprotein